MNQKEIQQAAHEEAWDPKADKVKINTINMRIDPTMTQKQETYQVILDTIKNTTFYKAFLATKNIDFTELIWEDFHIKSTIGSLLGLKRLHGFLEVTAAQVHNGNYAKCAAGEKIVCLKTFYCQEDKDELKR
ncbi:hypothetical protein Tco_0815204 [Tanacetum coccineum]